MKGGTHSLCCGLSPVSMWVLPREVLVSGPFWSLERSNPYFLLQRRKGRSKESGANFSALLAGTLDAVMDTRPPAYRILYREKDSEVFHMVAEAATDTEALGHWRWLETELVPNLETLGEAEEATIYVLVKVESLAKRDEQAANDGAAAVEDAESLPYKHANESFRQFFNVGPEDKLVSYYSCSWWQGGRLFPAQGWMYLTVNHMAFRALNFGTEYKLLLRWTEVTDVNVTRGTLTMETVKDALLHELL